MSAAEVSSKPLGGHKHNEFGGNDDGRLTVASTLSGSYSINSGYTSADRYTSFSRLSRTSIKVRSSSSFPSILKLYEPIEEEKTEPKHRVNPPFTERSPVRKQKDKPRRFAKSKEWGEHVESRFKSEPPVELERFSKRNRTVRIEAIAREQMDKYDKYINELNTKVEKQREKQRKRDEMFEERLKQLEEEGKKKLKVKKRPKEDYVHDRDYVKTLPKSNLSKMVRLSDDLQQKGILKTPLDVDKFWKDFGRKSLDTTGADMFKRDPLTEVPDARQWMGKKSTLQSLDEKARKKKSKKMYNSVDSAHALIPEIPTRRSRQRKAKSSEELPGTKDSSKSKETKGLGTSPGPSDKNSDITRTPSVT